MRNYLKIESPNDLQIEKFVESLYPAKFFYEIQSPIAVQTQFDQSSREFWVMGVDEAGRGPVAGPVTAGACMMSSHELNRAEFALLNDSKKLNEKRREDLFPLVQECADAWGVASASPGEIDEHNILGATFIAMKRAIRICLKKFLENTQIDQNIPLRPLLLLVDGNQMIRDLEKDFAEEFPQIQIHQCPVIQGDGHFALISAASILAKVNRDHQMLELAKDYPGYQLEVNKGYPSPKHIEGIRVHGRSEIHRRSFHIKAIDKPDLFNSSDG